MSHRRIESGEKRESSGAAAAAYGQEQEVYASGFGGRAEGISRNLVESACSRQYYWGQSY